MELNPADDHPADQVSPDTASHQQDEPDTSAPEQVSPHASPAPELSERLDLDVLERELQDVETALARLDDGSYWVDEITGDPLADELLAAQPTTRTVNTSQPTDNAPDPHRAVAGPDQPDQLVELDELDEVTSEPAPDDDPDVMW